MCVSRSETQHVNMIHRLSVLTGYKAKALPAFRGATLIDTHGGGKHGLLSVIYLFTLLARGCSFRLLMAAVGTNRVHTHLDPYCVAGCQVTHTHTHTQTHKHLYTKGETLCTAACDLCLKLIVFLDSLSFTVEKPV